MRSLSIGSVYLGGMNVMKLSTEMLGTFTTWGMFKWKEQTFILSLQVNGVNITKQSTYILRMFISWDMFHGKSHGFHRIAAFEWRS